MECVRERECVSVCVCVNLPFYWHGDVIVHDALLGIHPVSLDRLWKYWSGVPLPSPEFILV